MPVGTSESQILGLPLSHFHDEFWPAYNYKSNEVEPLININVTIEEENNLKKS